MKRLVLALVAVALAFFAVRHVVFLLVSDETKIAWLIGDMAEGFNDQHARRAVEGLATDWKHADATVDRPTLQAALFQEFRSFGQSKKGRETYRVELPEDLLTIVVDGETAVLTCEAIFAREQGTEWTTVWRIRIAAQLRDGEEGWEIHTSRHEDLVGWGLR